MSNYRKTMAQALREVYLVEDNVALMRKAADGAMQTINFKGGKQKMDSFSASAIMKVFDAVNPKNRKSMETIINKGTVSQMLKLQSFAMKQIKSEFDPEDEDEEEIRQQSEEVELGERSKERTDKIDKARGGIGGRKHGGEPRFQHKLPKILGGGPEGDDTKHAKSRGVSTKGVKNPKVKPGQNLKIQKRLNRFDKIFGKEEIEIDEDHLKPGAKIKVPHKGKMVQGKVVRFDKGGPASPFYVVDVGERASIKVPEHKLKEELDLDEARGMTAHVIVMRKKDNKNLSVSVVANTKNVNAKKKEGYVIDQAILAPNGATASFAKEIQRIIRDGDKNPKTGGYVKEDVEIDEFVLPMIGKAVAKLAIPPLVKGAAKGAAVGAGIAGGKHLYNKITGQDKKKKDEEVEIAEGKMKELHGYIQQGKKPEWIAKTMGLDVKTIKSLMASYNYEEVVKEGTWQLPQGNQAIKGLKRLLAKPIELGKMAQNAKNKIDKYIGDDELFDDLEDAADKNPKGDARPIIKKAMNRLNIREELVFEDFIITWKKKEVARHKTEKGARKLWHDLIDDPKRYGVKQDKIRLSQVGTTLKVVAAEEVDLGEAKDIDPKTAKIIAKMIARDKFDYNFEYSLSIANIDDIKKQGGKPPRGVRGDKMGFLGDLLKGLGAEDIYLDGADLVDGSKTIGKWKGMSVGDMLKKARIRYEEVDLDEARQLKDKKKEMMVKSKDSGVIVIDKKDFKKYQKKGYFQVEGVEFDEAQRGGKYGGNSTGFQATMIDADKKKRQNEASAAADARRSISRDKDFGKKRDRADVDDDATDDDIKGASKNIMMQMRKSMSLRGNFPVEFMDRKKIKVDSKIAAAVTAKYMALKRPAEKQAFQSKVSKSYKDMLAAVNESLKEDKLITQESILERIDRKLMERKNG